MASKWGKSQNLLVTNGTNVQQIYYLVNISHVNFTQHKAQQKWINSICLLLNESSNFCFYVYENVYENYDKNYGSLWRQIHLE